MTAIVRGPKNGGAHPIPAKKPIPVPSGISGHFWEEVDAKRLSVQRCATCERMQHPPAEECRHCHSKMLSWITLSGRGTINSFQIVHDSRVKLFRDMQPYTVILVESIESPDVLFIANLLPTDATPAIGACVEVVFEEIAPGGRYLPQFRLGQGASA